MDVLIYLYGTEGCHLCEEVSSQLMAHNYSFTFIDIANDYRLTEEFGLVIPVIRYKNYLWKSPLDLDKILLILKK